MGGKRKREERRVGPASRTKPKVAGSDQLDKDNATIVVSGTGTKTSRGNPGSKQPPVDGTVTLERDPEVDPGIAHNNQDQELLEEHSFSTPVLADADIDIGDVVKIMQYPQDDDHLIPNEEDEGGIKEAEISHNSKAEGPHPIVSGSKASKRKVGTPEVRNNTGTTGGGRNSESNSKDPSDVNVIYVFNERVEKTGSNPAEGAPLIIQNQQVAVPSQLPTNEQERSKQDKDQASSLSDTIAPVRITSHQLPKDASNGPLTPSRDVIAENKKLMLRLESMQNENELLHKEVTELREENKELTWFKNKYTNSTWDGELHFAAYRKTEEDVKKLVEDGAYINSRNKELATPIMDAAVRKDKAVGIRIIKYLIESGADPYAADNENRTFLHDLLSNDDALTPTQFHDVATYLISKKLAKLFNTPGWSSKLERDPLQCAIRSIEVEGRTLSALHESGVDFKVISKEDGENLLCYVLEGNRSTRLMMDLILLGVDWRHLNHEKRNLLHIAGEFCHINGIKYFLTLGLDVNAVDDIGDTPLHRVMLFGKGDVLGTTKVLITNGANLEIENVDRCTPLEEALRRGDFPEKDEVIRLLEDSEQNNNVLEADN